MARVIHCDCGYVASGATDDELVAEVLRHASEAHPGMELTRDQILAMAREE